MTLNEKLQADQLVIGALATSYGDENLVETLVQAGYDFVMYDCEHGTFSLEQTARFCRVARLRGLGVLVRCHVTFASMRRHLDMGPDGLILPMLETAAQADLIRDATRLPPAGHRGPGGPSVDAAPGIERSDWDTVESRMITLPQIETQDGLDNLQLLERGWISGGLLGPYDLLMSLQLPMSDYLRPGGPHVAAIQKVIEACTRMGKPCGMVCADADAARPWVEAGCRIIVCGEVLSMLGQQATRNAAALREMGRPG